jgi:uncharacterized protein (DUF58 family)
MPRERLDKTTQRVLNPNVFVDLQTLIKLQYEIRGFSLLPKQPVQSLLTGRHRSKLRGRGLDFDEVRAYAHGDDIRKIDWRVTSRTQKPHTKTYTEERERPVYILVDQSSSMFFGSKKLLKSVTAAHVAALAAWKVLAVGDRVGGIVFNDNNYITKPKRDRRAVQRFLQEVVKMNNALDVNSYSGQKNDMLNEVLKKTNSLITHDYLLLVISDLEGFDNQTLKTLINLSRHNDIILAHVSDSMEKRLPDEEIVLSNGELQMVAGMNEVKTRERFAASFTDHLAKIRNMTKGYGITLLEFNTIDPVSDQIRKMLSQGSNRTKRK